MDVASRPDIIPVKRVFYCHTSRKFLEFQNTAVIVTKVGLDGVLIELRTKLL